MHTPGQMRARTTVRSRRPGSPAPTPPAAAPAAPRLADRSPRQAARAGGCAPRRWPWQCSTRSGTGSGRPPGPRQTASPPCAGRAATCRTHRRSGTTPEPRRWRPRWRPGRAGPRPHGSLARDVATEGPRRLLRRVQARRHPRPWTSREHRRDCRAGPSGLVLLSSLVAIGASRRPERRAVPSGTIGCLTTQVKPTLATGQGGQAVISGHRPDGRQLLLSRRAYP